MDNNFPKHDTKVWPRLDSMNLPCRKGRWAWQCSRGPFRSEPMRCSWLGSASAPAAVRGSTPPSASRLRIGKPPLCRQHADVAASLLAMPLPAAPVAGPCLHVPCSRSLLGV